MRASPFSRIGAKILLPIICALSLHSSEGGAPEWRDNYDAALAAGMAGHRPILILFDAPASSSRRKNILPELDSNPIFAEFASRQLVLARIPAPGLSTDAEAERRARQLRANHGVGSLPALILLDSDGRTLGSPALRSNQSTRELVGAIGRMIPPSLLALQATNAPPQSRAALTIDLSAPTNISTTATTIDLGKMRREGSTPPHPSLIILPQDDASTTNMLNRRMPR